MAMAVSLAMVLSLEGMVFQSVEVTRLKMAEIRLLVFLMKWVPATA